MQRFVSVRRLAFVAIWCAFAGCDGCCNGCFDIEYSSDGCGGYSDQCYVGTHPGPWGRCVDDDDPWDGDIDIYDGPDVDDEAEDSVELPALEDVTPSEACDNQVDDDIDGLTDCDDDDCVDAPPCSSCRLCSMDDLQHGALEPAGIGFGAFLVVAALH